MSAELIWRRCDHAEFPPENTDVWITDYKTVRHGKLKRYDWMSELNKFEFDVPIHVDGGTGHVHVFWPCDASQIQRFLKERFDLDGPERDSWEGVCVSFPELDAKAGCPTALIALRTWEANADKFALLAHECFHAAEWMLKQTGHEPPANWMDLPPEGGPREAWEDAAYLLQGIMRRVLVGILSGPSSPPPHYD